MTTDSTGPDAPPPVPPAAKPNGLATYLGILFSPGESFATLARTPMWGWAAIVGLICMVVATIVQLPEIAKVSQVQFAQQLSQMPADRQAAATATMASVSHAVPVFAAIGSLVVPWIIWLVAAVVFLIAGAATKSSTKFTDAWVLAVNSFVVVALTAIINAIIVAMRGPDAITRASDAYAIPSLGLIAQSQPKLFAFLYAFNPLALWYYVVAAIGLQIVMRMKPGAAWITAVIYALLGAAIAAAFAR
ncbi:MAG TPA: YIP1 family protein [Candidatus Eremiobacteraceae bacterium]|nr:YIP1 family protein [Candidatus Eremiobacteraceae bacterium]